MAPAVGRESPRRGNGGLAPPGARQERTIDDGRVVQAIRGAAGANPPEPRATVVAKDTTPTAFRGDLIGSALKLQILHILP